MNEKLNYKLEAFEGPLDLLLFLIQKHKLNICDINTGDIILMCTDGLSNYVDKSVIIDVLSNKDISDKAEQLIQEANNKGGGDNITAVVLEGI